MTPDEEENAGMKTSVTLNIILASLCLYLFVEKTTADFDAEIYKAKLEAHESYLGDIKLAIKELPL